MRDEVQEPTEGAAGVQFRVAGADQVLGRAPLRRFDLLEELAADEDSAGEFGDRQLPGLAPGAKFRAEEVSG